MRGLTDDIARCAGAILTDRQLAQRAAAAVSAIQSWYPQRFIRSPCFSCRAIGHIHGRQRDGRLHWSTCAQCAGQGWFWRERINGGDFTDREIVALHEREQRRPSA
jgi:hypothetical protein